MTTHPGISVVYVTQDAERLLGESLASVSSLTDDIVVIDSGSTDQTVEIARAAGARVQYRPWAGFGAQKQYAVTEARHDWVLVVDADEVLAPGAGPVLRAALAEASGTAAFVLPRENYFHGRRVRFGDWGRDHVLRLVDRRVGHFSDDAVHESWQTRGPVASLAAPLRHYSFPDYASMIGKLQQYSDLNGRRLAERRARVAGHEGPLHALGAFVRSYVLRLGFLDGADGLGIALVTALGSFLKYAKAREYLKARDINP